MPKLKIGALPDDKPVKVTTEFQHQCIGISSPMQRPWHAKAGSASIRQS